MNNSELTGELTRMAIRIGQLGSEVNDLMWRLEDIARANCLDIDAERTSFDLAISELEDIRTRLRSKIR